MESLLSTVHREAGRVLGQICIALVRRRVPGGAETLRSWARTLRTEAERMERFADGKEPGRETPLQ